MIEKERIFVYHPIMSNWLEKSLKFFRKDVTTRNAIDNSIKKLCFFSVMLWLMLLTFKLLS